jgi:hypothetical protein
MTKGASGAERKKFGTRPKRAATSRSKSKSCWSLFPGLEADGTGLRETNATIHPPSSAESVVDLTIGNKAFPRALQRKERRHKSWRSQEDRICSIPHSSQNDVCGLVAQHDTWQRPMTFMGGPVCIAVGKSLLFKMKTSSLFSVASPPIWAPVVQDHIQQ